MTLENAEEVRALEASVRLPPFYKNSGKTKETRLSPWVQGRDSNPERRMTIPVCLPLHHPAGSVRSPQQIIRDPDAEAAHIIDQTVLHLELAAVPVFQPPVICIELLRLMLQLGDLPPQLLDLF